MPPACDEFSGASCVRVSRPSRHHGAAAPVGVWDRNQPAQALNRLGEIEPYLAEYIYPRGEQLSMDDAALFGVWWLDPVAARFIAGIALREGKRSWRGDACGCATCSPLTVS